MGWGGLGVNFKNLVRLFKGCTSSLNVWEWQKSLLGWWCKPIIVFSLAQAVYLLEFFKMN